jgi:hypothetical protein
VGFFYLPCGPPTMVSQTSRVCQILVLIRQSAGSEPHEMPSEWFSWCSCNSRSFAIVIAVLMVIHDL